MLAFLTDAHISPEVSKQITVNRPEITIHSLRDWHGGTLHRADDEVILAAARDEGLTLITYDQHTIMPLVTQWGVEGHDHAGVVFISKWSIAQKDVGGQIRALIDLWDAAHTDNWMNVITYLKSR